MTPLLCQFCTTNPATIHFTEIHDGKKRELHVCEECANEKGIGSGAQIPTMLVDLLEGVKRSASGNEPSCPRCGITFSEFRTKGRFGCPNDYAVFAEALEPLLDKIHGAHQHTGRLPRGQRSVSTDLHDRLLRLRRALQESVQTENYEDAARLRDEIREVERSIGPGARGRDAGEA